MRSQLLKAMELKGYTYNELANKVDCSVGVLSKFFVKQETIKFEIILSLTQVLCPDKEKEFMFLLAEEVHRPSDTKMIMEYLALNSEYDALMGVVQKFVNTSNKKLKNWTQLYRLIVEWKTKVITGFEAQEKLQKIQTSCDEISTIVNLIEANIYYDTDNFVFANEKSKIVKYKIDKMEDGYLKKSFRIRYLQILAHVELYVLNRPKLARSTAKKGLGSNFNPKVDSFFYNIIATSYFGESAIEMNHYAQKSFDLLSQTYYKNKLPDIKNRFAKLNFISSGFKGDQDFYEDRDDPLDIYLKGKMNKDIFILLECLAKFIKNGDHFFSSLVIDELRKNGCNESLIESIDNIK